MNQKRSQGMSNLVILKWRPSSHASLLHPAPQKPINENSAAVVRSRNNAVATKWYYK